jgi:hypothetical protein
MGINWNNIRPLENSQNEGFEELVCQLARKELPENGKQFIRKGKPDAGVECFWILDNEDELAWQAKFFTTSLSAAQWGQLDDSVKTVLEKHPRLKVYYIAIPTDPSDARLDNQTSMLEKWNEHVVKWQGWASAKGLEVEFKPWWGSDLIERISRPQNAGLKYFWFNKEEFTDERCIEQTQLSITELGKRYTPQLNVELEISKIFDGLARNENFKRQINDLFDRFLVKGKDFFSMADDPEKPITEIKRFFEESSQLFFDTDFIGVERLPYDTFGSLLGSIAAQVDELDDYYSSKREEPKKEANDNRLPEKYSFRINRLRELSNALRELQDFIESTTAKLSNQPVLVLDGEAGIGKSHLLADVVTNRNANNKGSIFVLGQHFVTDEDPWTQIFKKLGVRCSIDEFLGSLNAKGELSGSRFIIFIDAINEGRGKYFWDKNVKSFIQKILRYEWLGLVLSVRSSYKNLIFPEEERSEELFIEHTHHGFRDVEYEATKLFFDNYGIELPSVPLLHPEFQNPLFLKLFCEGLQKAGYTRIPGGFQGITSIIEFFINSINQRLSRPDRFEYPQNINVVKKAIEAIIAEKTDKDLRYVPYENAYVLADRVLSDFSSKKGFLEELISEGVLSKNLYWKSENEYEEGVYLAYERFEDHLTVAFLIESQSDLETSFSPEGKLYPLVKDENAAYINKNLIEAFAIQLPEKTGKEFYEYVPDLKEIYPVVESFVQSLLWRKIDTITEKLIDYINEAVFNYRGTYELFWDTIISVTAIPDHYFNGYSLHRNLMSFDMADRDATWTQYLKYQFDDESAAKRLIDWGWSNYNKDYISDESIKLASITLAWFHTSTNRKLRDSATKALICLLENRISVLIEVLKTFESINDPYVYERLFAVAYGCAIRTDQRDKLPELSEYIYHTIFENKDEIYPHILLRDYARGVIEFTAYLGYELPFDIEECRPPYKSTFPDKFLTNEELDAKYKFDYNASDFKDYYWSQNTILSSMTTEYGRGTARYGDFGRYTFQSAIDDWDVNPDEMSNIAVEWIFEKYGYDVEKHGEFDRGIGAGRARRNQYQERIGKKYQWIALYEILARISDNFDRYDRWSSGSPTKVPYEGPWEPYVRDINPTMTINKAFGRGEDNQKNYWWIKAGDPNWEVPNKEWLLTSEDLPEMLQSLKVIDDSGQEWLILEGYPSWRETKKLGEEKWKKPYKRLWGHIRSYLVKDEDFETIKAWIFADDKAINLLPRSHDRYEIFSREFYWSPAHRYFFSEEHKGNSWQGIEGRDEKVVASVIVTTERFLWEEENDYSKEETISFLKPCTYIHAGMEMKYSKREGEFIDDSGHLVCFDPSVYNKSKSYLLIRQKPFLNFLEENNLKILWTVTGEKNIIDDFPRDDLPGWLIIKGIFGLENGEISGTIGAKNMD